MQRLAVSLLFLITGGVILFLVSMIWISAPSGGDASPISGGSHAGGSAQVSAAPSGLAIPVAGVQPGDLVDTFTQSRAGGARAHDAIDIVAPRGTPVVAAAEGLVEKLYLSEGGGITAYVRSPDRQWIYYYAHLDSYAPDLAEGRHLDRGDPLGTVGSTGNANPEGPHLHFAIHRMGRNEGWHQGVPINPYPLLAGSGARR